MRRLKCLVSTFFYLFLKVLFDEWSFAPGFCPFYGTWWGILSKLYFVYLGTSWRILSKLYFVYLLSTFLINFAHLDLNQSFLRNWHSTDTFFLAMCWGGGVRTGAFFGHTQLDYKWSRRRCDNEIVTVLSNEQFTTLFLTKQNHFRADTSIHWKEFICKVSTKFLYWFRRRCDKSENQRWLASCRRILSRMLRHCRF